MTVNVEKGFSSAAVASGLAVLFAYGCAMGTIYLKAYWGKFGIDPFQFCSPSDLVVVGFAAIGVTCALALVAAMVGDAIGRFVTNIAHKARWVPYAMLVAIAAALGYFALYVADGWLLTAGVFSTWFVVYLWHKGSPLPRSIQTMRFLPLLITALVYLPFAVTFLAYREARRVQGPDQHWQLNAFREVPDSGIDDVARLAGRLGDIYVIYEVRTGSVVLLSTTAAQQMVLVRRKAMRKAIH